MKTILGSAPGCLMAIGLLLVAGLSGCFGKSTESTSATTPPSSTTGAPHVFDGNASLAFVKAFAVQPNGEPRFRIPGTVGQTEGAAYLWSQMDLPGWERGWQNLTGQDYLGLDRSTVAGYGPGSRSCSEAAAARVPSLPFGNLYAILHSDTARGANAGLLLVAAHWDSQMHSDMDPDPERRKLPDPGANDGASGVGVLLQLMRELQGSHLTFDVGVLFLDGEDGFFDCYPLAGSLYFAQNPPVPVNRFLLLDMVGDPGARFIRENDSSRSDKAMQDLLWKHGRALGGKASFTERATSISDDHLAFIQAGVPSVDLIDAGWDQGFGFPPQWDTSFDTVDRLSPGMLSLVGGAIMATLQDPAFVAGWPGPSTE